jgi:hypothetical protein
VVGLRVVFPVNGHPVNSHRFALLLLLKPIRGMTTFEILQTIVFIFLTGGVIWLAAELKGMKQELLAKAGINQQNVQLQLQAFERLTLFAERCGLKNLVGRVPPDGVNAATLQEAFLQTLKTEYEYNITQQIYVSPEVWRAISNLKEQNIYIINQIAATLPPDTPGMQLSKSLLELLMINEKADLSSIVLDALQFEAKKIL